MDKKNIKTILEKIYKKDQISSIFLGRRDISTQKIKRLREIAPNIPVNAWLDVPLWLKEQESKNKKED
ncbi:hypothetical protein A9K75_07855 [Campylobacter fetus subsp. testudinum]|uniref:hypothetical protein n=1 Tax=Campylobacter fetus TaxID=196 RepID=UPI000818A5AE|nr:hypothetical protein [Campylobacter fetus]OCR99231.1 hypothetical protein A9K75_07855 [Campylobacter fetus subsp. testudinum]OCS09382.1 hypothetical protein CFTD6783_08425 [Campylobacter fetus subsp. testudinum]